MKKQNFSSPVKAYFFDICLENFLDNQQYLANKNENPTPKEVINFIYEKFLCEHGFEIKRKGEYGAFSEWLQGLTLSVDYYYHDIDRLGKEWGILRKNARQEKVEEFYQDWFNLLTRCFFGLKKQFS